MHHPRVSNAENADTRTLQAIVLELRIEIPALLIERLLAERQTEAERQKILNSIPVRRHGTVEDIAAAVAYFASEESGFVNGASLDINGGQAMVI